MEDAVSGTVVQYSTIQYNTIHSIHLTSTTVVVLLYSTNLCNPMSILCCPNKSAQYYYFAFGMAWHGEPCCFHGIKLDLDCTPLTTTTSPKAFLTCVLRAISFLLVVQTLM